MKEKTRMQKIVDFFVVAVTSRTVWSAVASAISLIIYFRTGLVLGEIGVDDPVVVNAVEKASGYVALLANLGVVYFRVYEKK